MHRCLSGTAISGCARTIDAVKSDAVESRSLRVRKSNTRTIGVLVALLLAPLFIARGQEATNPNAPIVSKVEPPSWWVGLTPDVMVLLSGKHLEATHAECNLSTVKVLRTQSSGDGHYLFVWL